MHLNNDIKLEFNTLIVILISHNKFYLLKTLFCIAWNIYEMNYLNKKYQTYFQKT